ncbi:MAG: NTP transferase domain-containing protein [Lachnospiraceae bacterium]|nr:NTP transferase domain-containing protein [Lachnospiraceae bacterium]MCM1237823.1 NTP transferase domain-containing protein [Lachnospiraceae bacterium]MCM1305371.1 NTP transferase domain-containing protein [Butyrivibrio sp.]MCM1342915.1 NTP transferase domain-containing protein [Muribaculaceae bacterium]MCM1412355.1 NTP transferase domain-containing protein [Lachnospiraceae bacterium]
MSYKVDNAVIMAAGTSSRFAPLSYEMPKALIEVKGEILIERQIRQLHEAGISQVILVVGYRKEQFEYLKDKFGVNIVENKDYLSRNNNASIYAVRRYLGNTYICSSDNYFSQNPFESEVSEAYYAAVYADGDTAEWCLREDPAGYIDQVTVGGRDAWYMLGHAFWDERFSRKFMEILEKVYEQPETRALLWESIYMAHLDELKLKIRKYPENDIFEFDTLDELRMFDNSYIEDTRSKILKATAAKLQCREADITDIRAFRDSDNEAAGFMFSAGRDRYEYVYETKKIRRV